MPLRARCRSLSQADFPKVTEQSRLDDEFFVVGQQAVLYVGEAIFLGRIEVGSGLFEIGQSSLRFSQGLFSNGNCFAIAEAVLVFSRHARAIPLPEPLRISAQSFLFAEAALPPPPATITAAQVTLLQQALYQHFHLCSVLTIISSRDAASARSFFFGSNRRNKPHSGRHPVAIILQTIGYKVVKPV